MTLTNSLMLLGVGLGTTHAQGFGGYNGGNPYSNGNGNGNDGEDNGGFGNGSGFGPYGDLSNYRTKLIAHAVLATLAFGFFFPVGGIIIRLASCRGLWWMHGLFQLMAYVLYIAAFALGIYMVRIAPGQLNIINNAHPIIGIVLFILLFFQPFLGLIHHLMFKKYSRRTVWSYGHLWLGRIIITLGIINGGLGLQLARNFPLDPAGRGPIIGYSVAAGIMWLLYVISAIVGESRRRKVQEVAPPTYKEAYAESQGSGGRHGSQKGESREQYA